MDILWESLDEEHIKKIEVHWAVESEDRIDAVDRGELQTIDGPSTLQVLRSSVIKMALRQIQESLLDRVSTVTR